MSLNEPRSRLGNVAMDSERRSLPDPVPHDAAFLDRAQRLLMRVYETRVGRALVDGMRPMAVITMMSNFDNDFPEAEPPDVPGITMPWSSRDARAEGTPLRHTGDLPETPEDDTGRHPEGSGVGTGRGTGAVVYLDLAGIESYSVGPDGVLVHELTHAVRQTHGAVLGERVHLRALGVYNYPNLEELYAQVVMNMFLSELGRSLLIGYDCRAPATARRAWPETAPDRQEFLLRKIQRFAYSAPSLKPVFDRFARIPRSACTYNPFRDARDGNPMRFLQRDPRNI